MGNDAKLAELILHVAAASQDDPTFGATKLNKILFYAEFLFYARHRRSITGQEYMRLDNGPAPKRLVPVRRELLRQRALAIQERAVGARKQKRPIALRDANLDGFTGTEIAMVDAVIEMFRGKSATEVSNLSHQFPGWKAARDMEVIPYETVTVSNRPPTPEESAFARTLIDVH